MPGEKQFKRNPVLRACSTLDRHLKGRTLEAKRRILDASLHLPQDEIKAIYGIRRGIDKLSEKQATLVVEMYIEQLGGLDGEGEGGEASEGDGD